MSSVIVAIVALGFLVIVHEAGHYFAAIWSRMSVTSFSIGFGPVLAKVMRGKTEFRVSLIPLGGYVQIVGMNPHDGSEPSDPSSYRNASVVRKFMTIFAGPLVNYVVGFGLLFVFFSFLYVEELAPVRIVRVMDGSPAETAGIQSDDLVVGTLARPFERAKELKELIEDSGGEPVVLRILRAETATIVHLQPETTAGGFRIGVELQGTGDRTAPFGVVKGAALAWDQTWAISSGLIGGLAALIMPGEKKTVEVSGPIGLVRDLSKRVERSWVHAFADIGAISIMLGLFNLFPIPALDGSRLLFLVFGVVRRKEIEPKLEAMIHGFGFLVLLSILVLVSIGDVLK